MLTAFLAASAFIAWACGEETVAWCCVLGLSATLIGAALQ